VSIMRAALTEKNSIWTQNSLDGGNPTSALDPGKQMS
jgi:hypothetical protein